MEDRLAGGGEGLGGGFMDLLMDTAPQQPAQQRLGSLSQPGPGERGARTSQHLCTWFELRQVAPGAPPACTGPCFCCQQLCPAWRGCRPSGRRCRSLPSSRRALPTRPARRTHPIERPCPCPAGSGAAPPAAQQQAAPQLYAAGAAAFPGGYAGPTGGIPQQPVAGANLGLQAQLLQQQALASGPAAGVQPSVLQQPYAVPGGSLSAQVGGAGGAQQVAAARGRLVAAAPEHGRRLRQGF